METSTKEEIEKREMEHKEFVEHVKLMIKHYRGAYSDWHNYDIAPWVHYETEKVEDEPV